jgi:hypothetical protein
MVEKVIDLSGNGFRGIIWCMLCAGNVSFGTARSRIEITVLPTYDIAGNGQDRRARAGA